MIWGRTVAAGILVTGVFLSAALQVTAASRGGNRNLEKIIKNSAFNDSEAAQIARAFKVAVDADVDDRDALAIVELCADGEFAADQVVRVLTVATQLSLEGLPIDLFVLKIKEGVSKSREPGQIVQVAESRALQLNQASKLLKQAVFDGISSRDREELLPDIAEALASGMDQAEIREILLEAARDGDSPRAIRRKLFP